MVAIWVPWPTLQESTFPFSSNLGILGSGVIRNEQTLFFTLYWDQAANAYDLDPLTYNSFSSRSQYYTDQLDKSENPFYQANQAYSTYPRE